MKSIQEQLLSNGIATTEMTMDQLAYNVFAPKQGYEYTTEDGFKVVVVESSYYPSSELCIIRFKLNKFN